MERIDIITIVFCIAALWLCIFAANYYNVIGW